MIPLLRLNKLRTALCASSVLALLALGTLAHGAESVVIVTGNASAAEDKLIIADQDGGSPTAVVSNSSFTGVPARTAVDRVNRRIYVCDQTSGGGGLFRFNADGTGKTTIYTNSTSGSQVLGVAVDGTHSLVYFTTGNASSAEDKLFRCDLNGGSLTTLVSGASYTAVPNTLAVDDVNQRVYVADQTTSGGGVFRFNSDGTGKTTIYANSTSGSQVLGLAVDSSRSFVYLITGNATAAEDRLIRCDLSGGSPTTLVSGASLTAVPSQVTVDISQNRLYVADQTSSGGGVYRFNSDGTGKTTIYANSVSGSQVLGLAMLAAPSTTINSLNRVNATPSNASTVNWTATFGVAVSGLTASNFSLSGTAVTGASIGTPTTSDGGINWNVPVTTGSSDGTLQLNLANSTSLSPSVSTTLPFNGQAYTIDKTAPSVSIGSPSGSLTKSGPITYTVTYSDANFNSSTLVAGNVTVNSTGSAAAGSVVISGSGTTRTVTLSSITGNGSLGISIAAGTATDTAGNSAGAAGPSTTFAVDNTAPTVSIGAPSSSSVSSITGTVNYTVTYADANFNSSTLIASNVTLNTTGSATGTVAVTGSGTTRTVTISSITGSGTIGISIAAGTATDTAGNSAPAAGPSTTFTVVKATASVTLGSLSATYDGSAKSATATTTPGGLTVNFTYDGSGTAPTDAGSYAVVGTISDANYQGSASGTLVIGKATATVALGSLSATYDGSAKSATATTTPGGLTVNFTYDGSGTAPTNAGSYAVVGTISDANYQGSASGTLVIGKATALVTLGGLSATYDGSVKSATATTTPAGLTVNFTYDGSGTAPINVGSYAVVGTISDANYQGSASGTLVIGKATALVTLGGLSATYDGSAKSATATTTPAGLTVNFTYDGSGTAPTNAGSYAVIGTINDANYQGTASGTLVIGKATATVTLGNLSQTYNGSARVATATTAPSSLTVNFTYDGSGTAPINAGSYAVIGTISDANYQGSGSGTLVVGKVGLTVTADAKSRPYGVANPTLTATITGFVGGDTSAVVSGSPTLATAANATSLPGTYDITTAVGTLSATNYTFNPVNGTLTVTALVYADWQEENFTPSELLDPGISGPSADPDLDGVSNLYEYAFGTDPNDAAHGPFALQYSGTLAGGVTLVETGKPVLVVEVIPGTGTVSRVLFVRRKAAFTADLEYTPQFSATGTTWTDGGTAPTVLAQNGLYELVSVPYPATIGGKKTRFFQVIAELTDNL